MWHWLTREKRRRAVVSTQRPLLQLEELETREVPAINIALDYTYDTGFFSNPEARATLQRVANELGSSLSANLAAIVPSGSNSWGASFFNPATGGQVTRSNLNIGANTITLFVGARNLNSSAVGVGGYGGYSGSGSQQWLNTLQTRGWNGFSLWGGSISFDSDTRWHFGQTTQGLEAHELDFYSVATHELGHVLGLGSAPQWNSLARNGFFYGPNAQAVYGGPVPLAPDGDHWSDNARLDGQPVNLDPSINYGTRVNWTPLDAAALRDIGWGPTGSPQPTPSPSPTGNTFSPAVGREPFAFTGNTDGTVAVFTTANGVLSDTGQRLTPFAGYRGAIRVASGDFNGDGINDFAFTTGAGPQAVVQVMDGRDGSIMVGQTVIFQGFMGGLFLAAADIDGDGKSELVVSADAGAGPHIQTFRITGGALTLQSSFFAFDNPAFRGGARVAAGDINRDGFADVVVTTGGQAEGRVAIYSGKDLRNGIATRLFPDFIAFAGLWSGLNSAVGDMDGDGFAELAISPDNGPAHIKVWSGLNLSGYPGHQASTLPLSASFYGFAPTDASGARVAIRDTNGDGRAELVAASGNRFNSLARVFTFEQMVANGANAPSIAPFATLHTFEGIYVG